MQCSAVLTKAYVEKQTYHHCCYRQGSDIYKQYLIWRTMAASLSCWYIQLKIPSSSMSFQMAPWPPGFRMGAKPCGTSHLPSAALTSGTRGCRNSLQQHSPLPSNALAFSVYPRRQQATTRATSGRVFQCRCLPTSLFTFCFVSWGTNRQALKCCKSDRLKALPEIQVCT